MSDYDKWYDPPYPQAHERRPKHNKALLKLAREEAYLCHYCGVQVSIREGTKDHIVPRAYGGLGFEWNLVYSCAPCNHSLGHQYLKCDCSKCSSARLRWELSDDVELPARVVASPHGAEALRIRREARDRHANAGIDNIVVEVPAWMA